MSVFPTNIADEIVTSVQLAFPDYTVVRRPVRNGDPDKTYGIWPWDWNPDEQSFEMNSGQSKEPTLQRYLIRMQTLVKYATEEEGREVATVDAKILRTVLYRDADLQVRLGDLTEDLLGTRERLQRWGVRTQRFMNNQVGQQQFIFLTQTDFWAESESTPL
jgi:hypothetical protein